MEVTLGSLQHEYVTKPAGPGSNPGMSGTITFNPNRAVLNGSISGWSRAINITDQAATTNPTAGLPLRLAEHH